MFKVGDILIAIQPNGIISAGRMGIVKEMYENSFSIVLFNDGPYPIPFLRTLGDSVYFEKIPPVLEELF